MTVSRRFGGLVGAWRPLVQIVLVALAFAAGFALVYYVTVRTVQGRLFGDASLRGALLTRSALADGTEKILNVVSVASLLGAVAVVATIALVRLERVRGIAAVGVLVGANVSTLVLKNYLLERPDLGLREVSPATLNSLPSGHTTAVCSAVAALLLAVPSGWRYPVGLAGLVASIVTGLATMSAGWHRAGDSMAALLLVGAWTAAAAAAVLLAAPRGITDRVHFVWPTSARWLAPACAGVFIVGLTMGVALGAVGSVQDAALGSAIAFLVGGLLITGTGIAVLLGVLHALNLMDTPPHLANGPAPPRHDA